MQKVSFFSYTPYLLIALRRDREMIVTFNKDCSYTTSNPIEIELLRELAKKTSRSYLIAEVGGDLEQEELSRLHQKMEDNLVAEAAAMEKAKAEAEKKKAAEHELYSALRFSDKAYR